MIQFFLKKVFKKKGGEKGGGYFISSKMLGDQNFRVFSAILSHTEMQIFAHFSLRSPPVFVTISVKNYGDRKKKNLRSPLYIRQK